MALARSRSHHDVHWNDRCSRFAVAKNDDLLVSVLSRIDQRR
jgi:hypothetical protein